MKPPCDCTSWCGDDQDLLTNKVQGCESYLDRTDPKRLLITGLQRQAALMHSNANYLEQQHPQLGYHQQLRSAAQITSNWVAKFQEAT